MFSVWEGNTLQIVCESPAEKAALELVLDGLPQRGVGRVAIAPGYEKGYIATAPKGAGIAAEDSASYEPAVRGESHTSQRRQ